jgi:hypothetical protein
MRNVFIDTNEVSKVVERSALLGGIDWLTQRAAKLIQNFYFETVLVTCVDQKTEIAHEIKRKYSERPKTNSGVVADKISN